MDDVNKLMSDAQNQLDEHVVWLAKEIDKLPAEVSMEAAKMMLVLQCAQIKLRAVRADQGRVSIVWEYPDELAAFLRADATPKHLRDTLRGGQVVDTDQPTYTARRES